MNPKFSSSKLKIRYIKLGEGNKWAKECFEKGIIKFGYESGCDEILQTSNKKNWAKVREYWIAKGKSKGTASDIERQTREFFSDAGDTLWITFENGYLYYGFTGGTRVEKSNDKSNDPKTYRQMDDYGWTNVDINKKPLVITQLSGALTKVAAYRQTICKVEAGEYIKHRICGTVSKDIRNAEEAKVSLQNSLKPLIKSLTAKEFEILITLLFANSGWRQTSATGGTQKTIDFELENPVLNESAFVQVKTDTKQKEFNEYADKLSDSPYTRMFYVYHTGKAISDNENISIWNLDKVVEQVLQNGLVDWVISHSK